VSGFLYYLPEKLPTDAFTERRSGVFGPSASLKRRSVDGGPDKETGAVVTLDRPGIKAPRCGYFPETQAWHKAPDAEWWLGVETDARPTPADLIRPEPLSSHAVLLEDAATWQIPIALYMNGEIALPRALGVGDDGKFSMRPLVRYSYLSEQATKFWQVWTQPEADQVAINFEEVWPVAAEALRCNYFLGPEEVSLLGLVTTQNIWNILRALIDWPTVLRLQAELAEANQKKTSVGIPDGSSSNSGVTDSPEAMSPPLPTSNSIAEDTE